nr:unnamed protein product [Callosobruchus chinensis]
MKDIQVFQQKFYGKTEKLFQDSYIMQFCSVNPIQRKRPKNKTHKGKEHTIKCFVKDSNKKLVPVCKQAFMGILGITRRQIDTLAKNFYATCLPPTENRGRDRKSAKYEHKKQSLYKGIRMRNSILQ